MQQRQTQIEAQIQTHETALEELSARIGEAGEAQAMDQVHALGEQYRQLKQQVETLMEEWETLTGQLEGMVV